MNGKIKKILVIFAIFCSLQFGTFAFTCKKGVSYKEDREGTFEEVKEALEDNTCIDRNAVCISFKADEITIDGELKTNAVYMNCFEDRSDRCEALTEKSVAELNQKMADEMITFGVDDVVAGQKGAEASCCHDSNCNTAFLEEFMAEEEAEKEAEKHSGAEVAAKISGLLLSAAVLLVCFNQ